MQDLDIESPCIKCGNFDEDAFVEYKVGVFDPVGQENVPTIRFGERGDGYLLRTCRRCGYKWPERTLNINEDVK